MCIVHMNADVNLVGPTIRSGQRMSSAICQSNLKEKILEPFLDLCVSSLREGHANLLCIVPILTDVTEVT